MAGLLAAIISTLIQLARPALELTRIGAGEVAAEGLADGGLAAAAYMLFPAAMQPSDVDGKSFKFDTGSVQIAVADESARIDLNGTAPEILAGLYKAVGGMSLTPDTFSARVLDWRDEDGDVSANGAEAGDYASAGLSIVPRDGPMRSVDELRLILGLSQQDYGRLEPFVTVFNPTGLIDPFSASRTVLLAIPNLPPGDLDKLVKAHGAPPDKREQVLMELEGASEWFQTQPSGIFRVGVLARSIGGYTEGAEAVLKAPADESSDFGVLAWTRIAPPADGR
jgi:general secretion pathway protein K